ncbi:MAG: hypothetical protein CL607_07940 [Anaerolineaceae bacterium]|nr:hypothetical protein [Anaerolineaceae bacterium]
MTLRNFLTILTIGLLTLALAACSGLAGEPEIVRTLAPTQPSASLDVPVSGSSDPAVIFAENCTRCHGDTGAGDGELVQSGQITDIPDFTDPASIQDMSLDAWFEVITNGRLDKLMPPWRDSLSEEQRWAVAYYTYTMSYNAENVGQGETLFTQNCAECHSEDSTEEAPSVIGLTGYTESELVSFVSSHATELELDAPTDVPDSTAIVQYMRTLSSAADTPVQSASADEGALTSAEVAATAHAGATAVQSTSNDGALTDADIAATAHAGATSVSVAPTSVASTPDPSQQTIGFLRGNIIQGTEGGAPVDGLEAILHIYDAQFAEQVAEYTVGTDGAYEWSEVVIRPDFAYLVTVSVDGVRFNSDIVVGDPSTDEMRLDVTIYEATDDVNVLDVTSHATQVNLTTQGLYIIEVLTIENNTNQMYLVQDAEQGPVSVSFDLPEGAELQLAHTDPNRYITSDDGTRILDTQPVIPGVEHYVQYSYTLATVDDTNIAQTVKYPVSGPTRFFIERDNLNVTSSDLSLVGEQEFNGNVYEVYEINGQPTVGQLIQYDITVTGLPSASGTSTTTATAEEGVPREVLAVVLVIAGLVFIGAAGFIIWRGRRATPESTPAEETPQSIMQEIAMLDALYEEGSIAESVYTKQRKTLKAKLIKLMQTSTE